MWYSRRKREERNEVRYKSVKATKSAKLHHPYLGNRDHCAGAGRLMMECDREEATFAISGLTDATVRRILQQGCVPTYYVGGRQRAVDHEQTRTRHENNSCSILPLRASRSDEVNFDLSGTTKVGCGKAAIT